MYFKNTPIGPKFGKALALLSGILIASSVVYVWTDTVFAAVMGNTEPSISRTVR